MTPTRDIKRRLNKRLHPLYLTSILQVFVLWYAIERLFMKSIGFDDATIGLAVAIYLTAMLLTETSAGFLADRWSRKGTLMLAGALLALSSLIGGLSHEPFTYMVSAAIWGMFCAFHSGIYDSIIYDTVLEETGSSELYKHYFGRYMVFCSVGLISGSLTSGTLITMVTPKTLYFLTIPIVLLSLIFLLKFQEPFLHKKKLAQSLKKHISLTFHIVLKNRTITPILLVLIVENVLVNSLQSFSQLWLIALAAPTFIFGLSAVLLDARSAVGTFLNRLRLHRVPAMCILLAILLFSMIGLIILRTTAGILVCYLVIGSSLIAIMIFFSHLLHDSFESHVRSSVSSAISTFGTILGIPTSLAIGYTSKQYSVFDAGWLLLALTLIMSFFVLKGLRMTNREDKEILVPQ